MVEKWCRMKCRLTGWHLEPILIIISIPGFEDFISYPRCRSLAGFWIVATISNSFPARTPDSVISNDSVVRARCQHPVRHLHYQEVRHLHYLPEHLLFPQVPSAYHPVPHVQSMAPHVPTFTLCIIDDSIFSSVPPVKNPIPKCIHLYVYVSSTPSCILSGWRPNYRAPRQSFHGGQWERIQRFRFPRKQIWIEWDTVCHQPDIWSTATSGENGVS